MSIECSVGRLVEVLAAADITATTNAVGKQAFGGVEFDSREIKGGELFVALKGESTHGHAFLPQVFQRGAAFALVEDAALLKNPEFGQHCIVVENSLLAMQELARWWRRELKVPVISVTGSVGKTTVKEMIASILLGRSIGVYSLKSHNNHVGVPYTLLRLGRQHHWAVIETGMNHRGEIAPLSEIAAPNVAMVTCVAPAHIGNLGTLEAIADEKLDISAGLDGDTGFLITNGDDAQTQIGLTRRKPASRPGAYRTFGKGRANFAIVNKISSRGLEGISFSLSMPQLFAAGEESTAELSMSVVGSHNAVNAAAAALAAKTLFPDMTMAQLKAGLEKFRAPLMRLAITELANGARVIDDSYNANPASMAAAIELASDITRQLPADRFPQPTLGLILGDMLELGRYTEEYHTDIGTVAARSGARFVVTVGEAARGYGPPCQAAGITVQHADSPEAAATIAGTQRFDILLVKGSRGIGLDRAVRSLVGEQ